MLSSNFCGSMDTGFLELLTLSSEDAVLIASILKKYRDIQIQLADAALVHLAGRDGLDTIFTSINGIFRSTGCRRESHFEYCRVAPDSALKGHGFQPCRNPFPKNCHSERSRGTCCYGLTTRNFGRVAAPHGICGKPVGCFVPCNPVPGQVCRARLLWESARCKWHKDLSARSP